MDPLCRLARALGFDEVPPHFKEAFTHRSFAVERRIDYDNQRLEFLGDAVLELILTEYLYSRYPACREGELTKMRALCRQTPLRQYTIASVKVLNSSFN